MAKPNVIPLNPRKSRYPYRSSGSALGWPAFAAITVGASMALFTAIFLTGGGPVTNAATGISADRESASLRYGSGPVRINCIVDGDTFWYAGRKIRIADINTPEISMPGCAFESSLGQRARTRLHDLLNQGSFTLASIDRDQDRYGRDLRIVKRGGESLGGVLVDEGLAERWQGYRRDWC